eukprot:TRINITY_DN12254_c0_g1_i1.p1 TRINITY_DN12254_c0_g1~~TRINITY_DN12254_c0_g1_i1.p1  ORF type:complete len:265 (-),score=46.63 TRINITY_DN12254_c0_g1_i1:50-844(-)
MHRLIIVTGANRGIGKEIVRQLSKQKNNTIVLTSRNKTDGEEALLDINKDNVLHKQLDVESESSINLFSEWVKNEYKTFDVLINNAGFAHRGPELNESIAKKTVGVNYIGTKNLTKRLIGLLKPDGRIINVASVMGILDSYSEELKDKFMASDITEAQIDNLANDFINSVKSNTLSKAGFPSSAYKVSKALLNAYTRMLHREYPGYFIAAVCPGWVKTRMGGDGAPRSVIQGAETPVWLATAPLEEIKINGTFWKDHKEMPWRQ